MEDKKYLYIISWRQPYTPELSQQWLNEVSEAIVEASLENANYAEANLVIDKIKNL